MMRKLKTRQFKTPQPKPVRSVDLDGNFFPTLSDALDAAEHQNKVGSDLILGEDFREAFAFGGVGYGETKQAHVPIESFRGKNTRKWFHVVIYRMSQTGTYELVAYKL